MVKGVLCACVGGAIGAAIWAAIGYFLHFEIGWVAWGIGALVGFGMALGAGNSTGIGTGVIAAAIAIVSVAAGKYADAAMTMSNVVAEMEPMQATVEDAQVELADEIVEEFEAAGKTLVWPNGMTVEEATTREDYPPVVWSEMEKRWNKLSQAERDARVAQWQAEYDAGMAAAQQYMQSQGTIDVLIANLGVFDALWAFLAIGTAFTIGKGGAG